MNLNLVCKSYLLLSILTFKNENIFLINLLLNPYTFDMFFL